MPSETIGKTLAVAAGVCVVCSVFVSTTAKLLKERQDANKLLDKRKNVLLAAALMEPKEKVTFEEVEKRFKQLDAKWLDFEKGQFVDESDVPLECKDERKAAKDPKYSSQIEKDVAGIKRRARYRQVYFRRKGDRIDRIILPVHGKGLWSTMYGFLAVDSDMTTVKSFAFFEHGETPGLGGEVDNPRWKKLWVGKKLFDDTWQFKLTVVKGTADPEKIHEVDGLAGATLTARGVDNLVRFWLGEEGYGPMLSKLREGGDHG